MDFNVVQYTDWKTLLKKKRIRENATFLSSLDCIAICTTITREKLGKLLSQENLACVIHSCFIDPKITSMTNPIILLSLTPVSQNQKKFRGTYDDQELVEAERLSFPVSIPIVGELGPAFKKASGGARLTRRGRSRTPRPQESDMWLLLRWWLGLKRELLRRCKARVSERARYFQPQSRCNFRKQLEFASWQKIVEKMAASGSSLLLHQSRKLI